MKIVLINPPNPWGPKAPFTIIRDVNRSGRKSAERTIWPQTSLAMIAAVFPEHDVRIWDCIAEGWTYHDVYNALGTLKPNWVILESVSATIAHDFLVAQYAKYHGAKVVLISPHSEALAEETQRRCPAIDHVMHYEKSEEPEYALRSLITGQPRRPDESFESLPPGRQDLLPLHQYSLPLIGSGYTFVVTSRGCPWRCIYCRQTVTWKSRVRYRPTATILAEIRQYGLRNLAFHADTATVNRVRMLELCGGMPRGVRWVCNSRVDTVDLEMLKAMKRAGCWMVCFGIESGDDGVLAANKKEATVAQAEQAVRWAKEAGLKVWGYFMLGMFTDTPQTMQRTLALSQRLPCDLVNFALAAPYPGTEWGQIAAIMNWLPTDQAWEAFDQNASAIVDQPGCSHEVVKVWQRRGYRQWYFSPRGLRFALQAWRPQYTSFFFNAIRAHVTQGMA